MPRRPRVWLGSGANVHFAFAGVALLLLLLNLLTPSLLEGNVSSGSTFLSEGSLLVGVSGNDNLTFALESQGKVQYQTVSIGLNRSGYLLGSNFPGNASARWTWDHWINSTLVLATVFEVTNLSAPNRGEFLVNVTATTTSTLSEGTFAFWFQGYGSTAVLTVYPIWPLHGPMTLPGGSARAVWPEADLPQALPLAQGTLPVTRSVP